MRKFLLILAAVFCCTLGANAQETPDYFCLTINIDAGYGNTLTFYRSNSTWTIPSLEYKLNDGEWIELQITSGTSTYLSLSLGVSKVYLRAKGTGEEGNKTFSEDKDNYFYLGMPSNATSKVSASGNIMSLLDRDNFENMESVPSFAFFRFFNGSTSSKNTKLIDASQLRLPATKLGKQCYAYMFNLCSALTTAPALPATELADSCYYSMFNTCSNLTIAPTLPATTLKRFCYSNMFSSCSSLTSMEVGFTEWPNNSYTDDHSSNYRATNLWVASMQGTSGEFICPEELDDTQFGTSNIPEGWTVGHPASYITLNDNEAYTSTKDRTATVTYNRTFTTENLWEPLYVPFSINITADLLSKCDIADIYMVSTKGSGSERPEEDGLNVVVIKKFKDGDVTLPHTPYFIRVKASGDFTFTQENTLVKGTTTNSIDCSTTKDKYEFIGSYAGETLSPADGDFYILDAEGALTKISEETTLPCNRWYMKKTSRLSPVAGANLSPLMPILVIGEDDTTGIIGLDEVKTNANDKLYNMMGVAVKAGRTSLPAGVYLQHGKKFIVK